MHLTVAKTASGLVISVTVLTFATYRTYAFNTNFDDKFCAKGKEHNFEKLVECETVDHLDTTYDYGSVLHYSETAFAVDDSQNTITPHDPDAEIGQRIEMSELDSERVQILYGCLAIVSSILQLRHGLP